jgi:Prophage endopeptidase tail
MTTQFKLLIAGSEVDNWLSIDYENTLDLQVNKATIQFPDSSTLLSAEGVGQDIQIQRDGVAEWRGLGVSNAKIYGADGKKQYNLNCLSNKIYLQREIFAKPAGTYVVVYGNAFTSYENSSSPALTDFPNINPTLATNIFADILGSQNSSILMAGTLGASSIPHACILSVRQNALTILDQLLAGTLWEARFNPDNTVDFEQRVGSSSSVFTFQEGMNLFQIEVDYGIDKLINNVIVCGGGSAVGNAGSIYTDKQVVATASNSSSISSNGRFSKIVNLPNIVDANLLQAYANALLNDLLNPVYTINGKVADLTKGVSFRVGDAVTVNNSSFGLNGTTFRVISIQRHYEAQQGEDVNVVLGPSTYRMVDVKHFKLKALEYILNSQMQNNQAFNNTFDQTPAQGNPTVVYSPSGGYGPPGTAWNFCAVISNAVSGKFSGGTTTMKLTPQVTGTVTIVQVKIEDLTAGTTLYSDTTNNQSTRTVTSTNDFSDHLIAYTLQISYPSGGSGTIGIEAELDLPTPTIPT